MKARIESASDELRSDPESSALMLRPFGSLESAEARYRGFVTSGGWPAVPTGPSFRPGDGDPRTKVLARRHRWLYCRAGREPAQFPRGCCRFAAVSISPRVETNGHSRPTTIEALNVTAESRLVQLRANIARMRDLSQSVAPSARYVLVNIPAFQLEAVEEGQVAVRHRVIVGRTERPTPGVKAQIRSINFYPSWHVPDSVARLDLIPHLQKDPEYLQREHIRVLADWRGNKIPSHQIDWRSPAAATFKFRQDPGPWNALGLIRLDMPNAHAVYMHDTPMKDLFDQRQRAMSAGCVRVENVAKLAAWVLREVPGWERARVDDTLAAATR